MNIVQDMLNCLFAAGCCLMGSSYKHTGGTQDTFALTVEESFLICFVNVTVLKIFLTKILMEENTK